MLLTGAGGLSIRVTIRSVVGCSDGVTLHRLPWLDEWQLNGPPSEPLS